MALSIVVLHHVCIQKSNAVCLSILFTYSVLQTTYIQLGKNIFGISFRTMIAAIRCVLNLFQDISASPFTRFIPATMHSVRVFQIPKSIEENKYIPNNNLYPHDFPLYDHHHHFVSFSASRSPCLVDNNTHTQQTIPKFHNVKILSINIFYNRN